ncbi:hypothetical protein NDU88_001713 [Pleurodeles waltl]|uniref:Uncharacterized protein n=1 Tax=Pleurodeles waltl TaxID=8319 RepID=A0AAV7V8J9_PLEWA|nr:hypothetical protein NDU88_001713 [Pleurodeles waltl]
MATYVLEPFVIDGPPSALAARWNEWVDRLETYFAATALENDQRRPMLLHLGGAAIHKLGRSVVEEGPPNTYQSLKQALTAHFEPLANPDYDKRGNFRISRSMPFMLGLRTWLVLALWCMWRMKVVCPDMQSPDDRVVLDHGICQSVPMGSDVPNSDSVINELIFGYVYIFVMGKGGMLLGYCDGPSGGGPYTNLTGADAAPSAPDLPDLGTNQQSLPSLKAGPEPGTTGSRLEEKPASGRGGARKGGAGENGADGGDEETRRKQEDEEEVGRRTDSSATQEV